MDKNPLPKILDDGVWEAVISYNQMELRHKQLLECEERNEIRFKKILTTLELILENIKLILENQQKQYEVITSVLLSQADQNAIKKRFLKDINDINVNVGTNMRVAGDNNTGGDLQITDK